MTKKLTVQEMRGVAAEMLRAQRDSDPAAFVSAMNRADGQGRELRVSLCGLANKAMDEVIRRPPANKLVERLSRDMPLPASDESTLIDTGTMLSPSSKPLSATTR
jgi:hypothetical protein